MTIYSFYIFDRHCSCIYAREFDRTSSSPDSVNASNTSDMAQLLFGTIYSLKNILAKLAAPDSANLLRSFSTGQYRVHFLESLTNFKFALVLDLSLDNLQPQLWHLYSEIFVRNIVTNPLSCVEFGSLKLSNPVFIQRSDEYLKGLAIF